jgi:hypothetical protein
MAIGLVTVSNQARAQESVATVQQPSPTTPSTDVPRTPTYDSEWKPGGFLDVGYIKSFNSASNHPDDTGVPRSIPAVSGILRIEHRYDHSKGNDDGFFKDVEPGVPGLTPGNIC